MKKPYVVAMNSVSGGGKTALAELVASSLPDAVLFRFDDFDESNIYPDDFCGADILDFDCPGMAEALRKELDKESAAFVILDYPFGRDHPRFEKEIDLAVFINTPLDVAMARRILRDFCLSVDESAEKKRLDSLRKNLFHYLAKARLPYLKHYRHKSTSDLVLDGWASLGQLRDQVLERIRSEQNAALSRMG
jgi:uridine kinase